MESKLICRHGQRSEILALMTAVEDELFPGIEKVNLDDLPESDLDVWVGIYENGLLKGVLYALMMDGYSGMHNVHIVFAKDLRGKRAVEALYLSGDRLFSVPCVIEIFAWIPRPWRHVRWLAGRMGLQSNHKSPFVWFITKAQWYASSRSSTFNRRSKRRIRCATNLVEKSTNQ